MCDMVDENKISHICDGFHVRRSVLAGFAAGLWIAALSVITSFVPWEPAMAGQPASAWVDTESASVRLIASVEATGNSAGVTGEAPISLTMGLEFQLADNWKIYWRSPGDAGFPPQPDWSATENVATVDMAWPAPVRFSILGFETLGYKNEVVFPLTVSPKVAGQAIRLAGTVDYLICSDICVPETVDLALDIPAGDGKPSTFAHLINKYSVRVPGDGKAHGLNIDGLSLDAADPTKPMLTVSASSFLDLPFQAPDVYLEGPEGLGYGPPEIKLSDDGFRASLRVPVYPALGSDGVSVAALENAPFIATVVDGDRAAERTMTTTVGAATQNPPTFGPVTESSTYALLAILGLAFLGGLILNLMPCVLPVLSIKLLSAVSHGGSDARTVRLSFMASAAGIIVSFLIIAGILAALKAAGATVGWGIQFQQPWFMASMMVIVVVFACNLWGWFEVRLPTALAAAGVHAGHSRGMGGHFLTGMLATLLATPCSAPFLGTAVGFALARETPEILAVFAMLGLGLATPYILVALVPRLATMLPRPGQWMVVLRRILGIALAGTAGWLLWVISQQVGWQAAAISGIATVGVASMLYRRHRTLGSVGPGSVDLGPLNPVTTGIVFAIVAIAIPVMAGAPELRAAFDNNGEMTRKSTTVLDTLWQPFDRGRIDQIVSAGNVVFVDVTADWCITCQVNKSFVLADSPVIEQLQSDPVIAMQADWTLPDAAISDYLASFSRYGIPFNAVYGPGAPDGVMLPELLTSDAVMKALKQAAGSG